MSSKVPAPPPIGALELTFTDWPAGTPLWRLHNPAFGSTSFNSKPGLDYRFSSLEVAGTLIGVLYASDNLLGALSETLFHTLPADGDRLRPVSIRRSKIQAYSVSTITPTRPLRLIDLTGFGLGHQGMPVTHAELILSNCTQYAQTRAWAKAFYEHPAKVDGFLWISRQYNTARALVLFEGRVESGALEPGETVPANKSPIIEKIEAAAGLPGS